MLVLLLLAYSNFDFFLLLSSLQTTVTMATTITTKLITFAPTDWAKHMSSDWAKRRHWARCRRRCAWRTGWRTSRNAFEPSSRPNNSNDSRRSSTDSSTWWAREDYTWPRHSISPRPRSRFGFRYVCVLAKVLRTNLTIRLFLFYFFVVAPNRTEESSGARSTWRRSRM